MVYEVSGSSWVLYIPTFPGLLSPQPVQELNQHLASNSYVCSGVTSLATSFLCEAFRWLEDRSLLGTKMEVSVTKPEGLLVQKQSFGKICKDFNL